ncbi:sulfite exporter TauE/SafE family protein [Lederbergia galactosidilytica]|uniref:Probable membrane transporter protein n=1 Tax=Lederbergia galactosidilytica TaxID=217031 RepID=A0A177ZID6_9BACI|nr:sulfite exporter TauE/SafE family protein [Lederbergia galactosidilytica]KRG16497.1 membrane protein [Virgibacillus soli]MBP1914169.1 putative membrane protein YfcA [Lederbergia galactosidilytica]OAK67373.1 membrane protein [Lederbergia galactosidilytica]
MDIFLFVIIILFASILQTSTGFGFSILATPFLLLLFTPMEAIQINLILSLMISCALIRKIRKDIDFQILKRFVTGSVAGLPIGLLIFLFVDIPRLKLGVSAIILLLTLLLILKFRLAQTKPRDFLVGGLSGTLTTSIGMPGPPLLLYFSGTDTEKEKLRGTTLAFYLFIYSISLFIQVLFVGTNQTVWISSIWALPLVFIGLFLGQIIYRWINQRYFQIFTYLILLFTGIYLLFDR